MKNNGTVNLVNNDFFVSGGTGEPKLGGYTIDNGYMWHDNMYHTIILFMILLDLKKVK